MNYNDYDDIEEAVGANQLDSVEDDITDTLNGDFDDILDFNDDDLETVMDADESLEDILGIPDNDVEFAQKIVQECVGADEEGDPKAAISLSVDMVAINTFSKRTVAQQAMYRPLVYINRRMEFIEVELEFPTAVDSNLRVFLANLEKYGELLNKTTEVSPEIPFLSMVVFPLQSLGTYYMALNNPVLWALTAKNVGESNNLLKLVYRCEDVGFYQTDDIDIADVQAAIEREEAERQRAIDELEEKEEAKKQYTEQLEQMRRSDYEGE